MSQYINGNRSSSEDVRFFQQLGWQAACAVVVAHGLIVGSLPHVKSNQISPSIAPWLGLIPLMAATLTLIMVINSWKWKVRTIDRVRRLQQLAYARNLSRFPFNEHGIAGLEVGYAFILLMILVGIGLLGFSTFLVLKA